MPRARRLAKERISELSEVDWLFLIDERHEAERLNVWRVFELSNRIAGNNETARALWIKYRDEVMHYWISRHPGTRPSLWWSFDAPRMARGTFPGCFYDGTLPERRQQIGGAGMAAFEKLALVPALELGLPTSWIGFSEDNPPRFESQAAFLRRLGLLTDAERRKLKSSAFKPQIITDFEHGIYDETEVATV